LLNTFSVLSPYNVAQRGYLSRTQQRMSIKTIFNKLTSATATERKAAVHAELKQREQLHQQKKARAAKQAALLRLANEKKRQTAEASRTEMAKFRLTSQQRTELQQVCKMLGCSESAFLRDAVAEAVAVLHLND
jgi:hypothetical protein